MHIIYKRLLSGVFDLLLIGITAIGLSQFLHSQTFFYIFIVYFAIFLLLKGTPGSLIFDTKISFIGKNNKLDFFKLTIRGSLVMIMLAFIGCVALYGKSYPLEAIQTIFFFTALNMSSMIFYKKELMIHDIISRSFLENDNNPCHKSRRTIILPAFIILMLLILFI